ncbi:MAG: monovalent cation:proton antiporter-2 (CPA2) family protein [Pseudomonadota bacterium]
MATEGGDFVIQAATFLGAAAVAVPLANRFKLGSILGYLAAGVCLGPSVLKLASMEEGMMHVAELGVVLFLFIVGLELSFARLWALRRDIFGLGAAQLGLTGLVLAALFVTADVLPAPAAVIAGLSLAFSSTAFALQFMKDRGELNTPYGSRAFPVLLFQDIAVVPLLAAIPFFAGGGEAGLGWIDGGKMLGVVAVLIVVGKYGLNPVFRIVASSGSREAFAATALFIVAATAVAVSWAGLSMALGAFLAGALLAESSYRHQIETDIEPFRGLLLGLFFITIGMRLDVPAIIENWALILGGAFGLIAIKAILLIALSRLFGANMGDAMRVGAVLSQGGEFGFVVFSLGGEAGLFTNTQISLLSAIVTISMVFTPAALALANRAARASEKAEDNGPMEGPDTKHDHVIVAGFGRMGQIISQVVGNSGIPITAIDRDPAHIRNAERFGFKVYFGDAARLDVLTTAGAFDAKAVILCMDDRKAVNHAIEALRERSATLCIIAVAHDRLHEIEMQPLGADIIVRETMESSLLIAREALSRFGFADGIIDDIVQEFRKRDRQRLLAQVDSGTSAGMEYLHQPFGSLDQSREKS